MEKLNEQEVTNTFVTPPKLTKARRDLEKATTSYEKSIKRCERFQHELTKLENKAKQQSKQERKRRTHRLCTRAGHIESLLPETKELTDNQFMAVYDALFSIPAIQKKVAELICKVKEEY
ncbi:DUF3847 domain-containing protein [Pseudobutyrivibrio xylanivorans]|uniref:DUF3847 domain-containing protein n=1 Tax=Pseudobutyrivibrio xylanivorans TaxID=185007 RepID=A0A5P6VLK9_PSEXY|nr:DUF3847 domain-containing protein [Pseudobutyrivibrio xylanivorans]QFJ53533.1 DUF3847 domain-containing protein [Pseudobutyrivibrio xylanivorans]